MVGTAPSVSARIICMTFILCSLINTTIISLERLHATVRPFRHRFVEKRVYGVIIAVSYLLALFISVLSRLIPPSYSVKRPYDMMSSFTSACIFVIFFSYSVIFIKVKCSPQPRRHVVAGMERRLTVTLFFVTFVSLLMWLPYILQSFLYYTTDTTFKSYPSHLTCLAGTLLMLNSLVNPVLYVIRIPQFNRAVKALFFKITYQGQGRVMQW